jgi:APA family basic amino acid/polyamine antiporter
MLQSLFSTKPIGELHEADTENELRRTLDAKALVMLGIGAIIGTGIFVLTGTAAANHAGPALVVSFLDRGPRLRFRRAVLRGIRIDDSGSGSAYSYSYATLGEFVAWFIGWNLILEYLFAGATVAVGWSGYVVSLVEQWLSSARGPDRRAVATRRRPSWRSYARAPSSTCLRTDHRGDHALCYVGIHQSARFNAIVVAIKVTVIILFIGFGMWVDRLQQLAPVHPAKHRALSVTSAGAASCRPRASFSSRISVSTRLDRRRRKAKSPQRDMPIGIMASLVICTVLYVAVSAVLTGMVHTASEHRSARCPRAGPAS